MQGHDIPSIRFRELHRAHMNAMQAELAVRGLQDLGQPMILFILRRQGRAGEIGTQRQLADALHVSPATVAVSLKSLERSGYVEKREDAADGRRKRIAITPKGEMAVQKCQETFRVVDARMMQGFTPGETEQLYGFYARMIENLRGAGGAGEEQGGCKCD